MCPAQPSPTAQRPHARPQQDPHTSSGAGFPGALTTAERAFRLLTTGPDPLALECTGLGPGVPTGVITLDELRRVLTGAPFAVQQRVWPELVMAAQDGGPAWLVGVVGVALPALRRIASRVSAGRPGEREELDSEVLAGFCTALKAADPHDDRLPARLYWAAERAAKAHRDRNERQPPASTADPAASAAAPAPPTSHPDLVLAAAVRDGVLSGLQAELIGRTRLEKQKLREVADEFALTFEQLRHLRRTGERRLVAHLSEHLDTQPSAESIFGSVSHSRRSRALQTGEGASGGRSGPRAARAACLAHPAPAGRSADRIPRVGPSRQKPPRPAAPLPHSPLPHSAPEPGDVS